jgi:hypothetical protein
MIVLVWIEVALGCSGWFLKVVCESFLTMGGEASLILGSWETEVAHTAYRA